MKKLIALALALVMVLSLAACGGSSAPAAETQKTDAPAANTGSETPKEVYHVKLEMASLMTVPNLEATKVVENAVNDYLRNTLGETEYVVDLTIVNIADFLTNIPMELAGGQGPDLVMMLGNMPTFVDNGYLLPLDAYLENELKPTADLIGNIMNNGKINGSVYMIPRYFGTVLDWKFIYNNDLVNGKYDMTKVHDMDSLEECLAALKEAYPEEHFLVYCDQFPQIYSYEMDISQVGTYAATVGEGTELINYYASDAYKTAIYKAYEFRQKGYADPEGSANTLSHDEAVMSGSSKGVIMGHSADCAGIGDMFDKMNYYGADFEAVTIAKSDLYTDNVGIGISYTSKNPSAAARFINLLYTDEFVWDTLIYGAEGQDYGLTILVTVVGTAANLILTSLFAYPLSRKDFRYRNIFAFILFFTVLFNGGLTASYIVWTRLFHVKDTLWAYLLPGGLMGAMNVLMVRNYYNANIPYAIIEAARIDGANDMQIYTGIMIPLSKPVMTTVGLFAALGYWNNWTNGLYYITNPKLYTIQVYLKKLMDSIQFLKTSDLATESAMLAAQSLPTESARMAIAIIAILPILLVYPAIQGELIKGMVVGGVKG
ncbi:MAG: extracellular solute-binding protein [Faecousia sp.]